MSFAPAFARTHGLATRSEPDLGEPVLEDRRSLRRPDCEQLGPNGAGKTTAMKLITGFLEPESGTVVVAGHDVGRNPLAAQRRIGYLQENAPAYSEMTVDGFLRFVADARDVVDTERAIDRVVDVTTLSRVRHQTIETLSKGFKRRVGLAQAMIHDPEVLILDEPTDGLDPNQRVLVQDLLANVSQERCVILSTHILDEAEQVCNRAVIISDGRILVDSTPRALVEQSTSGRLDEVFRTMTRGTAA